MPHVVRPSWNLFDLLVSEAKSDLVICAPWISAAGVERLKALLTADGRTPLPRVEIWARIADINTDSPGILELIKRLEGIGGTTVVRDSPALHAKIYFADRELALVTSANLSEGGFSTNLEAAVVLIEDDEIEQVTKLLAEIKAETTVVSTEDLDYFVTKQRPLLVAQGIPPAPPEVAPVWRRPVLPPTQVRREPVPASPRTWSGQSRPVDFSELVNWVEASLEATRNEIQPIDLKSWVGKKVRACVCPCDVINNLLYLRDLSRLYGMGELEFGELLSPERFTIIEGVLERVFDDGRALFRQKRAREARIELTKYPDPGSRNALNNTDSRFLLKIERIS
jgi:hypothetical protein